MIYTDETGRQIQSNTKTEDLGEAKRVLAGTAIRVLERRLDALREALGEAPKARAGTRGANRPGVDRGHAAGRQPVRRHAAGGRDGKKVPGGRS